MTISGYQILGASALSDAGGAAGSVATTSVKTDDDARAEAVAYLRSIVGTPYVWASKDPTKGLDCSGAVTVAYEKAGLARPGARYKYGSADLHKKLTPTSNPRAGDLAFYGSGDVSHVMMCMGDGNVIGATGGGRNTKTPEDARAIGAGVKVKPVNYRKDLIGYGQAPSVFGALEGSTSTHVDTSDTRSGISLYVLALAAAGVASWLISKVVLP